MRIRNYIAPSDAFTFARNLDRGVNSTILKTMYFSSKTSIETVRKTAAAYRKHGMAVLLTPEPEQWVCGQLVYKARNYKYKGVYPTGVWVGKDGNTVSTSFIIEAHQAILDEEDMAGVRW